MAPGHAWYVVAWITICFELAGVLVVGTLSITHPELFAHASVWSYFGRGYLFVPLVIPVLGLVWLYTRRPSAEHHVASGTATVQAAFVSTFVDGVPAAIGRAQELAGPRTVAVNAGDRATGNPPGTLTLLLGKANGSFQSPVNIATGQLLDDKTVQVGARGFSALLAWARSLDQERVWALEDGRHVSG